MPVINKTKAEKRSARADTMLVWAESESGTEVSYPLATASISDVFSSPDKNPVPPKRPQSKKKPENYIPRPPNAFILFRSSFIKGQYISTEVETNHSTLSKIIGLTWQSLPEEERRVWHLKANEALNEHKRKFPEYTFRPVQVKGKGTLLKKRKVCEVEPKDLIRCDKIAQLLLEGKKGQDLEMAIEEFDKNRVPNIITRFMAPITAGTFRRSSSTPIPISKGSVTGQSCFPQVFSSPRELHSASTSSIPMDVAEKDHSFSLGNGYLPVDSHALPLEEPSASFGSFPFDDTMASPLLTYECHANSLQQMDSFGSECSTSLTDWVPIPFQALPVTSSPVVSLSPAPLFEGSPDVFDHNLNKSFDDFLATLSGGQPSCGRPQKASMWGAGDDDVSLTAGDRDGISALFEDYIHQYNHASEPLPDLDLDFSVFMASI